jgi:transposase
VIPAKIQVLHHKRLTYACPCCESYLITATKPVQPIEKSIASPGLLASVAVQKYQDALPLYRQTDIFRRIGVELDRTTLANWMVRCGQLIQPLINLIHERMLEQNIIHADETRVQVLNEPGRAAETQSFIWVLRSTLPTCAAVLFHYEPTRSGKAADNLLRDYKSALMVDGFSGYNGVCEKITLIDWVAGRMPDENLSMRKKFTGAPADPKEKQEKPIKRLRIFSSFIALKVTSNKSLHLKNIPRDNNNQN